MRRVLLTAAAFVSIVLTSPPAIAGQGKGARGSGGWGPGTAYQRMYDVSSLQTIQGEVVSIDRTSPLRRMGPGVHLLVKTESGTMPVHLGPSWFIDRLDAQVQRGDVVEVTGARVTFAGKPAIIAQEVKKGKMTLKLRDDTGIPVWAGFKR